MRLPYSNTNGVDTSKAKIVSMGTKLQERAKALDIQKAKETDGIEIKITELGDEELSDVLAALGTTENFSRVGQENRSKEKDGPILDTLGLSKLTKPSPAAPPLRQPQPI